MNIHTAFNAGRLTLYLSGELDHHEARSAASLIDQLLDEYLPRDCAVDMSGLNFMDSSGIAVLIRISRSRIGRLQFKLWSCICQRCYQSYFHKRWKGEVHYNRWR